MANIRSLRKLVEALKTVDAIYYDANRAATTAVSNTETLNQMFGAINKISKDIKNVNRRNTVSSTIKDVDTIVKTLSNSLDVVRKARELKKGPALDTHKMFTYLGIAGGIMAMEVFISEMVKYLKENYRDYKSKEYYKKMLEMHPQLKEFPPQEVAKYWDSLNHFSPTIAEDPLAAGAYITQALKRLSSIELGGPSPDTFATLVKVHKDKLSSDKAMKDMALPESRFGNAVSTLTRSLITG